MTGVFEKYTGRNFSRFDFCPLERTRSTHEFDLIWNINVFIVSLVGMSSQKLPKKAIQMILGGAAGGNVGPPVETNVYFYIS